jgi:predicted ArsR family transcriptional regulator
MYNEEEEKITLDKKTFKTLASDTRIGLLKSLNVRRKTLSELSKEHKMSVSTVKEHLDNLVGADLIVQKDDGHKWKYYELTRKGRAVLNPEEKKIWILLSLSAVAVIAAGIDMVTGVFSRMFYGTQYMASRVPTKALEKGVAEDMMAALPAAGSEASSNVAIGAGTQAIAPIPWIHIVIIAVFAVLAALFVYKIMKNRKKMRI